MSKIILDSLDWHGIAMLEYKIDKFTNKPYLLEINPRFWGSLNQAIVSGLNFPYWLYLISIGNDLNFKKKISLGVKTRFLLLDILAFPGYYRQSKDKVRLFLSYISYLGINFDLESLNDPKPAFRYYIDQIKKINQ